MYHRHNYRDDIAGPTWLYRLFYGDGRLAYVGVTLDPRARFLIHHRKPWWPGVVRVDLRWMPNRDAAFAAERQAIRDERPLHNIARPKGAQL